MNVVLRASDHRESSDTYAGELLRAGRWRVAACRDAIQWLLQRQRPAKAGVGGAWDSVSFCQSRSALLRAWRACTAQDGAALLALLPEHVRAFTPEWGSPVAYAGQGVGQVKGERA